MCTLVFLFLVLSVFFSLYSYSSVDPLKSTLGLLASFLCSSIYMSFFVPSWATYLFVLLFLSGILVVIITITSLSKFAAGSKSSFLLISLSSLFYPSFLHSPEISGSGEFYTHSHIWVFLLLFFLILILLLFMALILKTKSPLRKL